MLPEIGASELLIIAVVALIVVGPKDLPVLLRKLGQFMAKLRGMAAEFRASFDEMARQSELDELRKEVEAMRRGQFADAATGAVHADVNDTFNDIHHGLTDTGEVSPGGYVGGYVDPEPEVAAEPAAPKPARKRKAPAKATAEASERAKPAARKPRKPKAASEPKA